MNYLTNSSIKKLLFRLFDIILYSIPKRKKLFPQQVNKILIVKPDHLGDMLMLTSIFPVLHKTYPHAHIDIICGEWALPILKNNPFIRNKIVINGYALNRKMISWIQKVLEFWKTFSKAKKILKNESYDICLYMRVHKGNMIPLHLLLTQNAFAIGYGTRARGNFLDKEVIFSHEKHEIDTFITICSYLNIHIQQKSLRYQLYTTTNDDQYIFDLMNRYCLKDKEFSIVHMGSGNPNKQLDSKLWNKILSQYTETLVFTGLPTEASLATHLSISQTRHELLFGQLTIQQLLILMQKAKTIFTVESLSAHIAGMTDTPTFSYYTNSPQWWKPLNADNVTIVAVEDIRGE